MVGQHGPAGLTSSVVQLLQVHVCPRTIPRCCLSLGLSTYPQNRYRRVSEHIQGRWLGVCDPIFWLVLFPPHDKDGTWPQIYTDPTSRIEKYRRVLAILVAVFMLNLIGPLAHTGGKVCSIRRPPCLRRRHPPDLVYGAGPARVCLLADFNTHRTIETARQLSRNVFEVKLAVRSEFVQGPSQLCFALPSRLLSHREANSLSSSSCCVLMAAIAAPHGRKEQD